MVAVQNRALGGFARTLWARSLASTGPAASTGRLAPDQIWLAKPDITIAPAPNPRELPRSRPRSLDRGLFSPTDSAEDPETPSFSPDVARFTCALARNHDARGGAVGQARLVLQA